MVGLRQTLKTCNEKDKGNQITSVANWPSTELKPEPPHQAWSMWKEACLATCMSSSLQIHSFILCLWGSISQHRCSRETAPAISVLRVSQHERQKRADKRTVSCLWGVWEVAQMAKRSHEEVMGEDFLDMCPFLKMSLDNVLLRSCVNQ